MENIIETLSTLSGIGWLIYLIKWVFEYIVPYLLTRRNKKKEAILDQKKYVSKVKFDHEFQIYQELSEKNLSLVYKIGEITLSIKSQIFEKSNDELLRELVDFENDAEFCNKKYGPFISKELFDQYKELYKECHTFAKQYGIWTSVKGKYDSISYQGKIMSVEKLEQEIIQQQKTVSDKSDKLLETLRSYINSLECVEFEKNDYFEKMKGRA